MRTCDAGLNQSLSTYVYMLLTNASSLQVLTYDVENLPCPLSLSQPPLKHLTLTVPAEYELMSSLESLTHCQHLESLSIVTVQRPKQLQEGTHPELPLINLRSAKRLRHVQLVSFAPEEGQGLALPQGCALRLFAPATPIERWSKSGVAGAVTTMSVWPDAEPVWTGLIPLPGPRTWPKNLDNFPALQFLELAGLSFNTELDLGHFARIPRIKICTQAPLGMIVPRGSWELLELEGGRWEVSFADLHSFVCSVSVFAFTFDTESGGFTEELAEACRGANVPLHQQQHTQQDDLHPLKTKLSNNEQFVKSLHSDSAALAGVWQDDIIKAATAVLMPQ